MLSVLIPANNEAERIGACLRSVFGSELRSGGRMPEVIVMANGCTDETVSIANGYREEAANHGWSLTVLDIQQGGKLNALNAGDRAAKFDIRIYLDADVTLSPQLIAQLAVVLDQPIPTFASGSLVVSECTTWASRAYRRIYLRVPFITHGVPGCGLFAVNRSGRARWGAFPDIISDDTFVRLQFRGSERQVVPALYEWPIVEGFANLVKVRRRQNIGVAEIGEKFPDLLKNDDKPSFGLGKTLKLAASDPIGFAVYASVSIATRLTRNADNWSRGR